MEEEEAEVDLLVVEPLTAQGPNSPYHRYNICIYSYESTLYLNYQDQLGSLVVRAFASYL